MSDSPLFFLCFSDSSYFLFPVTSAVNNICFGPRLEGPRAAVRARPSGGSATVSKVYVVCAGWQVVSLQQGTKPNMFQLKIFYSYYNVISSH